MAEFFEPRTFGYEWEIMLLNRDLSVPERAEILEIAHEIRKSVTGSESGFDFLTGGVGNMLEIRSGILYSVGDLLRSTDSHLTNTREILKKKKFLLLPLGTHPGVGKAIGFHIHIGSIYDVKLSKKIADSLIRYVPVFISIAANSPFGKGEYGRFKSYRMASSAELMSIPENIYNDRLFHWQWGQDITLTTDEHSTIEFRVNDSPLSETFVKEYTSFVAAFVFSFKKEDFIELNEEIYEEYIINRWRATKYGLQAILKWEGNEVPVTEIIEDMIERCDFKVIGGERPSLIIEMLKKRRTQADWQLDIMKKVNDFFQVAENISLLFLQGDYFPDYIENSNALPVAKPEALEDFILSRIGKETQYRDIYQLLLMPYPLLDKYLDKLVLEGKVKVEMDPEKGKRYTKIDRKNQ